MLPTVRQIRAQAGALWRLAWPVMLAEIGWHAMTLVDTMIVGRVSAEALGGVSVGGSLFFVYAVFGIGCLLGMDFAVAHAFGAGRNDEARHVLRQGTLLAGGLGLAMIVLLRASQPALASLGIDPNVLVHAHPYVDAVSWSLLPLMLFTAVRRYLQAIGAVKAVMLILISANVINAVADWILVFGAFGLEPLGAAGAGWATLISRTYMLAGGGWIAWRVAGENGERRSSSHARIDVRAIGELLRLGLPAAFQLLLEVGVFSLATALAGTLEPTSLAAHHIVLSVAGLTFMMPLGLSSAAAVRVGQQLGAAKRSAAVHAGWTAILLGGAIMSFNGVLLWSMPRLILSIFTNDPAVIATGASLMLIAVLFQIFDGVQVVSTGVLRGTGETRVPMVTNLIGHWVLGLPSGYALCFWAGQGVHGLWIGLCLGLTSVAVVLVWAWSRRVQRLPSDQISGSEA